MYPVLQLPLPGGGILNIKVYTLFAAIAVVCAIIVLFMLLKRKGYNVTEFIIMAVSTTFFFLLGARVLNYVINYTAYTQDGYALFDFHFGHFSVVGGILLGAVSAVATALLLKKDVWLLADALALPFLISFAIIRGGCFFNGCCYGKVCDSWLGIPAPQAKAEMIDRINGLIPNFSVPVQNVYPTQLMEMAGALLFIPLAALLYQRHAGRGDAACLTISWFAAFRLAILPLRDLPYPDCIVLFVYPMVYVALITLGLALVFVRRRLKQ